MQLDHIQPRADNGVNDISNRISLYMLYMSCNGRIGGSDADRFAEHQPLVGLDEGRRLKPSLHGEARRRKRRKSDIPRIPNRWNTDSETEH